MATALTVISLLVVGVAAHLVARRINFPAPLLLIVVGFVGSYVPHVASIEPTPDLVLLGLLPPLLYAAAIRTPLLDFRANLRPILLLSVGLVLFTTAGVALAVQVLLDVPWPVAIAVGAIVAPPDAVAATSVGRGVSMPRRVLTIIEGESLVNDATAIVVLRAAIAGIAGTVTAWQVGIGFVVSAVGALVIGGAVAQLVTWIRRSQIDDTEVVDVTISLLTPWVAYLAAEELHPPGLQAQASGVLAVVVAGLILGHRSPVIQSGSSRLFERTNWATISFVLENAIFCLIGLQLRSILAGIDGQELSRPAIVAIAVLVLVVVMALRMVWVFPGTYLPRLLVPAVRRNEPAPSWQVTTLVGWAGMRGVVTLAAALLLPADTPQRDVLVFIAFTVTVGTLLVQGLTLPVLVRRLGVQGPDIREDRLQAAEVFQAVTTAGLRYLDDHLAGTVPVSVEERLRQRAVDRTNGVWERLGSSEGPSEQYARARAEMLRAERREVLRLRGDAGALDQTVLAQVLADLDVEESMLVSRVDRGAEPTEELRRPSYPAEGLCEHLDECRTLPDPRTPWGCEECLAEGLDWVHLRLCLDCGHVGCCDSSVGRHGTAHFHDSGHPVMRSFEPGESWRWCFVDELTG